MITLDWHNSSHNVNINIWHSTKLTKLQATYDRIINSHLLRSQLKSHELKNYSTQNSDSDLAVFSDSLIESGAELIQEIPYEGEYSRQILKPNYIIYNYLPTFNRAKAVRLLIVDNKLPTVFLDILNPKEHIVNVVTLNCYETYHFYNDKVESLTCQEIDNSFTCLIINGLFIINGFKEKNDVHEDLEFIIDAECGIKIGESKGYGKRLIRIKADQIMNYRVLENFFLIKNEYAESTRAGSLKSIVLNS